MQFQKMQDRWAWRQDFRSGRQDCRIGRAIQSLEKDPRGNRQQCVEENLTSIIFRFLARCEILEKKVCIYSFTKCKVSTEMKWKSAKSILPKCEISILEKSPSEIVRSRQWSQNLNFDCGILFFYQKSDSESLKTIFPSSARISYRDPKIRIQRCRFSS